MLEKWNFNTGTLIENFERQEISSLDVYNFFNFFPYNEELFIISKKGYLINYRITDSINECKVLNK